MNLLILFYLLYILSTIMIVYNNDCNDNQFKIVRRRWLVINTKPTIMYTINKYSLQLIV